MSTKAAPFDPSVMMVVRTGERIDLYDDLCHLLSQIKARLESHSGLLFLQYLKETVAEADMTMARHRHVQYTLPTPIVDAVRERSSVVSSDASICRAVFAKNIELLTCEYAAELERVATQPITKK